MILVQQRVRSDIEQDEAQESEEELQLNEHDAEVMNTAEGENDGPCQ